MSIIRTFTLPDADQDEYADLYLALVEACEPPLGVDSEQPGPPPTIATAAVPGTPEKLAVLAERAAKAPESAHAQKPPEGPGGHGNLISL